MRVHWTLRMRFWKVVHDHVNRVAVRWGGRYPDPGQPPPNWLWWLNNWAARRWVPDYLRRMAPLDGPIA